MGELAVVGQQQQTLGLEVQSAHVVEPLGMRGGELAEVAPPFGVTHRGDHGAGLVQHQGQLGIVELQPAPIDVDHLDGGVHTDALLLDDLAVHAHSAAGDQRLAGTTRAETGPGQHLLQPLAILPMGLASATRGHGGVGRNSPALAVAEADVPWRGEGAAPSGRTASGAAVGAICGHQAAAPREMSSRASWR